jgi:hypothetical protein
MPLLKRSRRQQPPLRALEHQAGELAGAVGAGVDADAVGPEFRIEAYAAPAPATGS